MKLSVYLRSVDADERKRVADQVETTVGYLYQVAGGHKTPSQGFALRLERATDGRVCRHETFPKGNPVDECAVLCGDRPSRPLKKAEAA
jgi:hypothetical protein